MPRLSKSNNGDVTTVGETIVAVILLIIIAVFLIWIFKCAFNASIPDLINGVHEIESLWKAFLVIFVAGFLFKGVPAYVDCCCDHVH